MVVVGESSLNLGQGVGASIEGGGLSGGSSKRAVCVEEARVIPAVVLESNEGTEVRVFGEEGVDTSGILGEREEEVQKLEVERKKGGSWRGAVGVVDRLGRFEHESFEVGQLLEAGLGLGFTGPKTSDSSGEERVGGDMAGDRAAGAESGGRRAREREGDGTVVGKGGRRGRGVAREDTDEGSVSGERGEERREKNTV